MKLNIKGSQSEQNLKEAFASESQARNRYTYFAMQARNEGNEQVAELFEVMADNELEHAKVWYKVLNGGVGDISTNLENAAHAEHEEWETTYPKFALKAREEGFELLAIMFENIAAIERNHEMLFLEMLSALNTNGTGEELGQANNMKICRKCGYVTKLVPQVCPVCGEVQTSPCE